MLNATRKIATTILLVLMFGQNSAHSAPADSIVGVWKGQYVCAQGPTGLTLSIDAVGNQLEANFSFYPAPGARSQSRRSAASAPGGEFSMLGTYDSFIGEVTLRPDKWIRQPSGYSMVGLKGLLSDDGKSMSGAVDLRGCQQFQLKKTSMSVDEARAAREANNPSPKNVKRLKSVRSSGKKCDVLLAWLSRLEVEYPTIDLDRIAATQSFQYGANLFLGDYFLKVFDKPYLEMSAGTRKRSVSRRLTDKCQRTWFAESRRNAHSYGAFLRDGFATSSPKFVSVIETRSTAKTWMDRILAAAESIPEDVENYELIESYLGKGRSQLAALWPSEQALFAATLRTRQQEIADVMLQSWAANLETMAPTMDNAAVILQELSIREKYFAQIDPGQAAAIKATANARIDSILRPQIDSELTALASWPHSLAGAAASVNWHRRFQQTFARFSRAGSVRSAEARFIAKRSAILTASINEFAESIAALPVTADAGRRASAALNETFPLASDRSLPAYQAYQDIVVYKLSLIENSKFDAQVASLLALSRLPSDLPLDGYTLPGLIGGIYHGQIKLLPDDLEQTRPQVAGLIKAMNDLCGEAPADVGFASISYAAPNMDDVMMQGMQNFAKALQTGDFTRLARNSRVAAEGFEDGRLLKERHQCASSQVRQFRSNLNSLILARYRKAPHPYNQRLFSALLSAKARASLGLADPMAAVAVTSSAASEKNLVQKYEREVQQARRSPTQQATVDKMKRVCNNLMMNMREVCDAAAKCGDYFVYFHPEHRKGGYRYYDVFTVSNTPPDAKVQTIQELWSYAKPSKTMGESQELSRGKTIPRSQLKPVLYPQKFGDYYGSQANICKPYRPGELSCNPGQAYCIER